MRGNRDSRQDSRLKFQFVAESIATRMTKSRLCGCNRRFGCVSRREQLCCHCQRRRQPAKGRENVFRCLVVFAATRAAFNCNSVIVVVRRTRKSRFICLAEDSSRDGISSATWFESWHGNGFEDVQLTGTMHADRLCHQRRHLRHRLMQICTNCNFYLHATGVLTAKPDRVASESQQCGASSSQTARIMFVCQLPQHVNQHRC